MALEHVETAKLKAALEAVLASKSFATGSSIFQTVRAAGNQILYRELEAAYGTPNHQLGRFCKQYVGTQIIGLQADD